jgi:predicted TIM-barrel fold metal-dependent hydrolase
MIIDSHGHIGYDEVADSTLSETDYISSYNKYGIDKAIIQPYIHRPYLEEIRNIHDRIHRMCRENPGRFWGMVSMNTQLKPQDFDQEVTRCVKELGFVGIKIAPNAYGTVPSSVNGMHVFEVADHLGVPVMVHTGSGAPLSDPLHIVPAARKFPDQKIVISHAGGEFYTQEAIFVAQEFENVYIEPSWINVLSLKNMLSVLGSEKIMFSSDHPLNIPVELAKYHTITNDVSELEQMFCQTVVSVFGLST